MTKLANLMAYGWYILLLFGTKSRPFCRNHNFELLMQNYGRVYSAGEFQRE